MAFELIIAGQKVSSRKWSGPSALRSGYRGPEPGSREAGNANFTVFDTSLMMGGQSGALRFDGTDDYVSVPSFSGLTISAVMTVAFWFRRTSLTLGPFGMIGQGGYGEYASFTVQLSPGAANHKVRFLQSTDGLAWQTVVDTTTVTDTTTWHCLVALNDGSAARIYLDNVLCNSDGTPATGNLWMVNRPLTLGCETKPSDGTRGRFCPIELDEIQICDWAWDEGERTAFWSGGKGNRGAARSGLLAGYHCDEGGGVTIADYSGHGHGGQLEGTIFIAGSVAAAEAEDVLARDQEIAIHKNGRPRYNGVITEVRKGRHVTAIESKESGARLADFEAGMNEVGGMANPLLYLYHADGPMFSLNSSGIDRLGRGFEVRTEESLPGVARKMVYEKSYLFDSYGYDDGHHSMEGRKYRTMVWKEETVEAICERVIGLSQLQGGAEIHGIELQLEGQREQMGRRIEDENGDPIRIDYWEQASTRYGRREPTAGEEAYWGLWGLTTRVIEGSRCTYLWISRSEDMDLYQVVNHGLAIYLGRLRLDGAADEMLVVPVNVAFPWLLSFYTLGDANERSGRRERPLGNIWEVNLLTARMYGADIYVPHRRCVVSNWQDDGEWVVCTGPGGYQKTSVPQITRETFSVRTGGRYERLFESENIFWVGDLWLSEAAYDFRGAKLRDVLHELSLLTGAEWWVDAEGVLRVERLDKATRTAAVQMRHVFEDETTEQEPGNPFEDFAPSGIPVTEYHAKLVTAALQQQVWTTQAKRRRVKFAPLLDADLPLGAMLSLNGEKAGRIVAVEANAHTETVELELA